MATRLLVVGCYRSGSSAISSILHHLGVDMGAPFHQNHFECEEVARELRQWWKEPALTETVERSVRIPWLRKWIENRETTGTRFIGIKHPLLACRLEDFQEAWGSSIRIIWADRPLQESVESLKRLKWFDGADVDRIQTLLHSRIHRFLSDRDYLPIHNADLRSRPHREIKRMMDYLGLKPDGKALSAALDSLRLSF